MSASQAPVADAPVNMGLTVSMPNDIKRLVPGPLELFDTVNANVALLFDMALSVNCMIAESVAPS